MIAPEGDKDCVTVAEDDSDMLGVKVGVTEMDLVTETVLVLEMEEASLTRPANVVSTWQKCRPQRGLLLSGFLLLAIHRTSTNERGREVAER